MNPADISTNTATGATAVERCPLPHNGRTRGTLTLGIFAAACFAGYLVWNGVNLLQCHIPGSIFKALTGLPCPTTGCTRSLIALFHGDWHTSLAYNAMTLPILGVLGLTLGLLAVKALQQQRLTLPRKIAWVWLSVMLLAWALKLTGNPAWW